MRLILIRHGQTPSNVIRALDTAMPGPALTELGQRQAEAVPAALAEEKIEAVYASTAVRAQQTAATLASALGQELLVRDGLKEIAAGDLEMATDVPSITGYLVVVKKWLMGDPGAQMPGAETGNQVMERFDGVVAEAEREGHQSVAMVSHGAMIRTWTAMRSENADYEHPENYELSNTGIVVLERRDASPERPWFIVSWNGTPAGGAELSDSAHDGPAAADAALPDSSPEDAR